MITAVRDRLAASHKPSGRRYTDTRREAVLAAAYKVVEFKALNHNAIGDLYDFVVAEYENWDGEDVSVESLLTMMVARYNAYGLAPSRN